MINFDLARTFWSCNPQYKGFHLFKDMYKTDISNNKEKTSKLCWAAALYCSINSECFNLAEDDRIAFIDMSLFEKPTFNRKREQLQPLIDIINKLEETPAQRQLKEWTRIMHEKNVYMATLSYRTAGKQLEEMLLSNGKLMSEYDRICRILSKEEVSEKTRGESKESLAEQGII